MTISISRVGRLTRITKAAVNESPYVARAGFKYKTSTTPHTVDATIVYVDETSEKITGIKITELTIGGVAITDQTVFDTQVSLVFPNTEGGSGGSAVTSFISIADMLAYSGDSTFIAVIGGVDYGLFAATDASFVNDGGTIYPRLDGGHWLRQFDKKDGVTPSWWAAQGNGIADDIDAIEAAEAYCMANKLTLFFRSGIYRISRQWVIGYKYIDESQYNQDPIVGDTGVIDPSKNPLIIEGSNNTVIFGDFDSVDLEAIIFYCILPWWTIDGDVSPSFNNLKITGKGKGLNQIGLMMVDGYYAKCSNVVFSDLQFGMTSNSCYFSEYKNLKFNDCSQAYYSVEQNASEISDFQANACDVGFLFGGSGMKISAINTENCPVALLLDGLFNSVINGAYFENINPAGTGSVYLISGNGGDGVTINGGIFSDNTGTPYYGPANLLHLGTSAGRFRFNDCTGTGNILNESSRSTEIVIGNYVNIQGDIVPAIGPPSAPTSIWVSVKDFGATGLGIADDADSIDAAVAYCIANKRTLFFPSGIYRVTRQIVLGYKFVDEVDFTYAGNLTSAPSFDGVAFGNAQQCQPIEVIGDVNVSIWGDFSPVALTAIFYYGTHSGGSPTPLIQPLRAGVKNIMFLSQDRIVAGVYNTNPYSTNLQVGLAAALTKHYDGNNTTCEGLSIGILMRDNYGAITDTMFSRFCGLGELLAGHNATTIINPSHESNLKDMVLYGSAITIQNFWTEECPESLTMVGTAIRVNGGYFEYSGGANIGQIIIGEGALDVPSASTAITLDTISITAGGVADTIQIRNAKKVLITNSNMSNCPITMMYTLNEVTSLNNRLSVGDTALDVSGAGAANVTYL